MLLQAKKAKMNVWSMWKERRIMSGASIVMKNVLPVLHNWNEAGITTIGTETEHICTEILLGRYATIDTVKHLISALKIYPTHQISKSCSFTYRASKLLNNHNHHHFVHKMMMCSESSSHLVTRTKIDINQDGTPFCLTVLILLKYRTREHTYRTRTKLFQ